ncbi:DUF4817 domain-containing protein [Trichonephila clavipes]|nr:DUF4817 domain-containing protein [Trichonephila clavipes]
MDAETATVLRGRAKAALTRTKYFIDKNDQTFDKNDIRNKLEKLELTYTEFDKADAALPIESSEMKEFETKYYETKAKLQNILENLSVRTYAYNDNSNVFENASNIKSSNFKLPKINIDLFSDGYRFNSCQVICSQFGLAIHQNDHQARLRFVEWAQNEIAVVPDFHKRILFSDEAHFQLNGYVNKQNCRIWSEANLQVYVETPLHPEKLTVWCALWAGGIILLQKR